MNIQELNIIKQLSLNNFGSQRELAESCDCSLGMVNRCIKSLNTNGYLTEDKHLTLSARQLIEENKPKRAIILAAGVGMRMVPVNMEQPKAMLEIKGEILIERLIRQLHEAGVFEIYIVVGFMKEQFEYLIDEFGAKLIVNRNYAAFNNLHSLALAEDKLSNAYIVPSDIWCRENPFSSAETYSWYMVKNIQTRDCELRVNRRQELIKIKRGELGNPMVGISYITAADGEILRKNINKLCKNFLYDHAFWEEALYDEDKMLCLAKEVSEDRIIEINTYEQLRAFKSEPDCLKAEAFSYACNELSIKPDEINNMELLKKGMTNQSFLFSCRKRNFVLRIPVNNGNKIIDYAAEKNICELIRGKKLSEDVISLNIIKGFKLSRYIDNSRACNPMRQDDLQKALYLLRTVHGYNFKSERSIDIFDEIEKYESLWKNQQSAYRDYETTKSAVKALRGYISKYAGEKCLTHMDPAPENFLIYEDADGEEKIRLIDWEYAGMQDPHVDIALFCVNALYNKEQIDNAVDIYFNNKCTPENRVKIYCYIAVCGLMLSNWCEYQMKNGAEFGEYSLRQYRYAKEFCRYAVKAIDDL